MNFSCLLVLAMALFGAFSDAYISPLYPSVGYNNINGGYAGGLCGTSVCDTCQCVKTIARPGLVESIPYGRSRRVHAPICGPGLVGTSGLNGVFAGGYAGGLGSGVVAYPETGALGFRSGYGNCGFAGFYGGHPCETIA